MTEDKTFFGHPRGLSTLFFTEMGERFGYYGMRALLILFMTASAANGGLGLRPEEAAIIYGLFTSSVYLLALPGGWAADRYLGQRRAVLLGGVVMTAGYFTLAVPGNAAFYLGLVLVVLGTGLLKPNISTMVGQLYEPGDSRRDAGFSIFYMGINVGAFVSPLICGAVGEGISWRLGFAVAGIGMTGALFAYLAGARTLGTAGLRARQERQSFRGLVLLAAGLLLATGIAAALISSGLLTPRLISNTFGALYVCIICAFLLWVLLSKQWSAEERRRLLVIFVLFAAATLFWSAFEQAGSSMNLFADRSTQRAFAGYEIPASWLQAANAMFIILLAPVFAWLWIRLGRREPSSPAKFAWGLLSMAVGLAVLVGGARLSMSGVLVSPMWLLVTYLFHTIGELCLSPVGLSAMTKLAPVRVASLMMGVWFMSNACGNYLAGRMAAFYERLPLDMLFGAIALMSLAAAAIMFILVRPVTRMMGGVK